jgi:serine O-acetyltransferase
MLFELLKGNYREYLVYRFIKALRTIEYYKNNKRGWRAIMYVLYKQFFQRLQVKTQLFLMPNVFGKGLRIEHPGFAWIDESSRIGENCTILPRVLLGKKVPGIPIPNIIIGNNCYIGTGVTILGPLQIGDNVIIAAGSVVIHDVPSNVIVAGNPATVKKHIDPNEYRIFLTRKG